MEKGEQASPPEAPASKSFKPDPAVSRLQFLKLVSRCYTRPASIDLVDSTTAEAASVLALRPATGEDVVVVLQDFETPIGTAPAASLRASDVVSIGILLEKGGSSLEEVDS